MNMRSRLRAGLKRGFLEPWHHPHYIWKCPWCEDMEGLTTRHVLRDCPRLRRYRQRTFHEIYTDHRVRTLCDLPIGALPAPDEDNATVCDFWLRGAMGGPMPDLDEDSLPDRTPEWYLKVWTRNMPRIARARGTLRGILKAREVFFRMMGTYTEKLLREVQLAYGLKPDDYTW